MFSYLKRKKKKNWIAQLLEKHRRNIITLYTLCTDITEIVFLMLTIPYQIKVEFFVGIVFIISLLHFRHIPHVFFYFLISLSLKLVAVCVAVI